MELSWSLDFCLACDKQTQGDTYCSQACRLADFESLTWSGSTSPTTGSPAANINRGSGFYLSPAINFTAYKASTTTPYSTTSQVSPQATCFSAHASDQAASNKTLSPSSSHSSLSLSPSAASHAQSQASPLSEQTRNELLGYTNSFDSVRDWKRRMTWS